MSLTQISRITRRILASREILISHKIHRTHRRQVATPLRPYIAEYNSHADFTDFTEGCIVLLAAVSELSVHIPEANANGVMRYLRNLRNPRETRSKSVLMFFCLKHPGGKRERSDA